MLCLYFLAQTYNTVIHTHFAAGEWEESNTVRFVYAVLGWLGTAAGALSVTVLWGFLNKQDWAWFWGAVAATVLLLAGFFPMIPAADSGLPVPTMWVFLLAAVMWFGMLFIGGVEKKIIALTFVAGLAYVLTFIDGVAPISKFQTTFQYPAEPLFTMQTLSGMGSMSFCSRSTGGARPPGPSSSLQLSNKNPGRCR